MDACLQSVLPIISKQVQRLVAGECCVTSREEHFLSSRAVKMFLYTDFRTQRQELLNSIRNGQIKQDYLPATLELVDMFYDNRSIFNIDDYHNVYILFDFYCPLHLKNASKMGGKNIQNLIVYIILNPPSTIIGAFCEYVGINKMRKWLGYNIHLPTDQY